jgi:hypothetical protein
MWEHLVMARKCGATNYVYSWTHMDANLANLAISKSYPKPFCQRLFGHFFHLPSFTQFQNLPPPYATPKCPQRATALWLDHARLVRYGCSAPSHGPLRRPLRPRRFGRPMAFGHWRYGSTISSEPLKQQRIGWKWVETTWFQYRSAVNRFEITDEWNVNEMEGIWI